MFTTTRLRTLLAVPVVACTTGMDTPSTRAVRRTVSMAARLGAALRRSARSASVRKKPGRMSLVRVALVADAGLAAQPDGDLVRGRGRAVEARHLVADDAAVRRL